MAKRLSRNVAELKLAWRTPLRTGANMPTPLIHPGVMFLHTYPTDPLLLHTSGVGLELRPHPHSSDGNMGRLQAVNLNNQQLAWSYRQPAPLVSALLTTAGVWSSWAT